MKKRSKRKRHIATPEERQARKDEASRFREAALARGLVVTHPLREWCMMNGTTVQSARRQNRAGKLKFTKISANRYGVRSDHGREYLDANER
jgi:hypothetical protein